MSNKPPEKKWYEVREGCTVNHRNQKIPAKAKILLTEEQAELHNTDREQVAACSDPKEAKEVGVLAEYQEWLKVNTNSTTPKPTNTDSKGKSSAKAK